VVVEGIIEEMERAITVGDIAIAGYDSFDARRETIDKYLTGIGTVVKICKIEDEVYKIYILIDYGIFPDPRLLPIYSPALKRKIGDPTKGLHFIMQ